MPTWMIMGTSIFSVGAKITLPGGGYYSAAKAALEAVSGARRKELAPLGVHVMVVEPGSFRTEFRWHPAVMAGQSVK